MVNTFNEYRQKFQEQLVKESMNYHYRFTRYHADYSIALAYISDEHVDLNVFAEHLRASDMLIFFHANLCAIIFDGTNAEEGIKAANSLLSHVQNFFFAKHLYMAVISTDRDKSQFQMVHDLFDLISYAITHNMDNLVVESSQVIRND